MDRIERFKALDARDKRRAISEFLVNNSLYFIILIAAIYIQIRNPNFLSISSITNVVSLTAANLPIALGIAGTIVLTGTDLSAGRIVGLTACVSAALLQSATAGNKMFPELQPVFIPLVILLVMVIGAVIGLVNGFSVAKFGLHPFIVTLATQLIVFGVLLRFLNMGNNHGGSIGNLAESYNNFIKGSIVAGLLKGTNLYIPNFIWFAILITIIKWFIWNKTVFGKNMFAVGSNPQAAEVSGVNVHMTIIKVFVLAGMMYGLTGFIEGARIGSNQAATGQNYELDAIAACVIGGVSFVGGIGKISGIIIGVVLLRLILVGLVSLSISGDWQYIIKGVIILVACAIDMRKYLAKK